MHKTRHWIWNEARGAFETYATGEMRSIEELEDETAAGSVFVHLDERGRFWWIAEGDSSRWHEGEELDMGGERYDQARLIAQG
ncbi:hypothetical protein [Crenobacter intestini]|uniref:Uncharacterized protein n=1 Tax=Crenobacter intestini TaxID=2563443 RepID=A0A4T0USI7_9NEIS|nr:hypothetical protein [Crenobacter intestini]TIC81455.1 hypothetical protein E5K04_11105 [Crenobacter intestini]